MFSAPAPTPVTPKSPCLLCARGGGRPSEKGWGAFLASGTPRLAGSWARRRRASIGPHYALWVPLCLSERGTSRTREENPCLLSLKCPPEEPKSALRPAALCRRATAAAAALATSRAARWPRAMSCTPSRPEVPRNRCSMGQRLPWARRLQSPCRTGEPSAAAQAGDPTRPDELTDIAGKPCARRQRRASSSDALLVAAAEGRGLWRGRSPADSSSAAWLTTCTERPLGCMRRVRTQNKLVGGRAASWDASRAHLPLFKEQRMVVHT